VTAALELGVPSEQLDVLWSPFRLLLGPDPRRPSYAVERAQRSIADPSPPPAEPTTASPQDSETATTRSDSPTTEAVGGTSRSLAVLACAAGICALAAWAFAWPLWLLLLAIAPTAVALAWVVGSVASRLDPVGRSVMHAGRARPGSRAHAVDAAFAAYAQAAGRRAPDEVARAWRGLRSAAEAAGESEVLAAMDEFELMSGRGFDEASAKQAIRRLRLAIDAVHDRG